jgi:hypothetical protein
MIQCAAVLADKPKIEKELSDLLDKPKIEPVHNKVGDTNEVIDIKSKLATQTTINPEEQNLPSTIPNETAVNRAEHVENKTLKKKNIMNTGVNNVNQKI